MTPLPNAPDARARWSITPSGCLSVPESSHGAIGSSEIRERVDGLFGPLSAWRWRVARTSNAYTFNDPASKFKFQTETTNQIYQERSGRGLEQLGPALNRLQVMVRARGVPAVRPSPTGAEESGDNQRTAGPKTKHDAPPVLESNPVILQRTSLDTAAILTVRPFYYCSGASRCTTRPVSLRPS
jgi:hypothetical protein